MCVQVYIYVHGQVCVDVHTCTWVCAGVNGCVVVCAGVCMCVCGSLQKCAVSESVCFG